MYVKSSNKKNHKISLWCSPVEKRYIEVRAREAKLSASEYMRELGLKDYLKQPKTLPPEVLAFNGQLYELAAALQPIARKRLDGDELNAIVRAELQQLINNLKQLVQDIKIRLQ